VGRVGEINGDFHGKKWGFIATINLVGSDFLNYKCSHNFVDL
jgi:hypothetical protein